MNTNISKPTTDKPVSQIAACSSKQVVQAGAFRPVQPKDLEAKRRKAYPYLF
jgi:hypothetical protein